MPTLNKLTANATVTGDSTRIEVFEGRDHMVAPCVAIVAGVLNGILISGAEISIFTEAWNGIPLTVNHPMEGLIPVSANRPDIIESQAIGRFWNAFFENDSLKGELWIDIQKSQDLGGEAVEILDLLENSGNLEVSTGFWAEHENRVGTFKGKKFFATAHNIRPDHLALLPNDIGACNWADGCGAPRINQADIANASIVSATIEHLGYGECTEDDPCATCKLESEEMAAERKSKKILASIKELLVNSDDDPDQDVIIQKSVYARTPHYESVSFDKWVEPTFADYAKAFDSKAESFQISPIHFKRFIARHSLLGDSKSYDFKVGSRLSVVNPLTGEINVNALRSIAERDTTLIDFGDLPEELIVSAQEKAKSLLANITKDFNLNVVVNRTDIDVRIALEGELARKEGFDFSFTSIKSVDMENSVFTFFQGDRLMQQSFEIDGTGIIRITGNPVDVQQDTNFTPIPDMDTNKEIVVTREEKINLLIANSDEWTENDRGVLSVTSEGMIDKLYNVMLAQADNKASGVASGNAGPGDARGVTSSAPTDAAPVANAADNKPWTLDDVPEEYRSILKNAMEARDDIIKRLVDNKDIPFTEDQLKIMSEPQLTSLEEAYAPKDENFALRGMASNPDTNSGQENGRRPEPPSTWPEGSKKVGA